MNLRIFVFTWNTQTVRYDQDSADFVSILGEKINSSDNDLVALGLQEDSIRDSPLLADSNSLLVDAIAEKYELIEQLCLSGWGSTTYKALKNEWDYRPRGLRLAVFKRKDLDLEITQVESKAFVCPGIRNWFTYGKGGLAINLHTSAGKVCFLNVHLPFNSRSLIQDPHNYRHPAVMWQAECLRSLYKYTINEYDPDHLFIFGDFNFRVQIRCESGATEIANRIFSDSDYIKELIDHADEFRLLLDYARHIDSEDWPVPIVQEGIDDCGPTFLPTCKMRQGREYIEECTVDAYSLGSKDQRTPSWCDRIFYKQFANAKIACVEYNRWEQGSMRLSDHTAVIGAFTITMQE